MGDSPALNRYPPFPYEGGAFPPELGVMVQRTVLEGLEPVRVVVHDADGDWLVGDGVNDPNLEDACAIVHMTHVLAIDGSLGSLAGMPLGQMAERGKIDGPWALSAHHYED